MLGVRFVKYSGRTLWGPSICRLGPDIYIFPLDGEHRQLERAESFERHCPRGVRFPLGPR